MVHCRYFDTTRKGNHFATLTPTVVGGRRSLPSENCAHSEPPPFKKCRLRHISAYNVSTVRDSEQSSIMTNIKSPTRFSTSYRWSAYVTSKSPKGWLKERFFRFLSKSQRLIGIFIVIVSPAVYPRILEIAELARSLCHS